MRSIIFSLFFMMATLYGCVNNYHPNTSAYKPSVYTPPRYSITVTPQQIVEEAPFGTITLTPGPKADYGFIESFILKIENTSEKDIRLDWNKTMFIQDGQTDGGFMFVGVVYSKRNDPKQADIIFADSTFEKKIWPNSRVFYSGGEYGSGWNNGELTGESGIYLSLEVEGKEFTKRMTMIFDNKKIQ